MDEDMESIEPENVSTIVESSKNSDKRPVFRTGGMVLMTLTKEDYEEKCWPMLCGAVDQLLNMTPGEYIPISYEQMYSCVYKCVCKQFSEVLYGDLMRHITMKVKNLYQQLQNIEESSLSFIESFSIIVDQYMQAVGAIVPIFNYLDRFYIHSKLKKDLNSELLALFRTHVTDRYVLHVLALMDQASLTPFTISPPAMAGLMRNLYSLNPEYATANRDLFARFIPNVLPPASFDHLDQYIQQAQTDQRQIQCQPGFRPDNKHKRSLDDDIMVN